ncbi:MAG: TonB family protein [Polyangiaceae bacterium]|nr:TonB family protein [Polyangiaceae bacterium]
MRAETLFPRVLLVATLIGGLSARPSTALAQPAATPPDPPTPAPTRPPAADAPHPAPEEATVLDQPARVLTRVEPEYPAARLADEHHSEAPLPELDVEVEVTLDEAGRVTSARVLASGGKDFDEEALKAVRTFTFAPAIKDGKPVASRFHVPLHFEPPPHAEPQFVDVVGKRAPPSRGAGDYRIDVGKLDIVPRRNAADLLKLAPSVFLLKDGGGEGHAERVYLRGFDAREGQDIEFSVGGVPINEAGNFHGNGYADLNFIIPELVTRLRVLEGPFDPRQGNFAVAGSAEYELGLESRGLTAKATYGSFNTARLLLLWGPAEQSTRTFAGAEIFRSDGFGDNRESWRARAMGQYEGRLGSDASFRLSTSAYATQYESAGLLRVDDVESKKVDFFGTSDPNQGGSSARFHVSADIEAKSGETFYGVQAFGIYRSSSLRENFTGFLLDEQLARQQPHGQRGDLIDLSTTAGTFGLRGYGRHGFELLGMKHEVELGMFARGDMVSALQQRVGAQTHDPYLTEADLDSKLADLGLYADATIRFAPWLIVRGGLRADLFAFDVEDNCAVKDVSAPTPDDPPGDASCLSQQRFGEHREPNQHSTTATIKPLPRVSAQLGPFGGFSFSLAYGQGVRSVDPSYVTQSATTPFASIDSGEAGVSFARSFDVASLAVQSVFFVTHVDRDQIFSETEGRATLAEGTTRTGWSGSARSKGDFFDVSASVTLVQSRFDDTGLLVPYVPDVVVRHDGALFHDLFPLAGSPVTGKLGIGASFVGARALPYGQRSDTIFLLDAAASLGWRFLELEIAGTNLANLEYRQAEFNYVSDFDPNTPATLVPARHFAAGQPIGIFGSISGTLGGER